MALVEDGEVLGSRQLDMGNSGFNVVESRETMSNNGKTAALAFRCVPLKGS